MKQKPWEAGIDPNNPDYIKLKKPVIQKGNPFRFGRTRTDTGEPRATEQGNPEESTQTKRGNIDTGFVGSMNQDNRYEGQADFDDSALNEPDFLRLVSKRQEKKPNIIENDKEMGRALDQYNKFKESYQSIENMFSAKIGGTFGINLEEADTSAIRSSFMDEIALERFNVEKFVAANQEALRSIREAAETQERYASEISFLEKEKSMGLWDRTKRAFGRFIPRNLGWKTDAAELKTLGASSKFFISTKGYDAVINSLKERGAGEENFHQSEQKEILEYVVSIASQNKDFINKIKAKMAEKIQNMISDAQSVEEIGEVKDYYAGLKASLGEDWAAKIGKEVQNEQIMGKSIDDFIQEALMNQLTEELGNAITETGNNIEKENAYGELFSKLEGFMQVVDVKDWKEVKGIIEERYPALQAARAAGDRKAAMRLTCLQAAVVKVQRTLGK